MKAGVRLCLFLGVIGITALLTACDRPDIHRDRFIAFGTVIELSIYSSDARAAAEAAQLIREELEEMHQAWHAWQPSLLTQTNELLALGHELLIHPQLLPLLEDARRLSEASDGLFHPGLGQLFALWGFHSDEPLGPPPSDEEITAVLNDNPSMQDLIIDAGFIKSTNPALQLDLGAYAKGYALDQLSDLLRQQGFEHAIINAGGDLKAMGRPGKRPWRIGIRDPNNGVLAGIDTQGNEAIFTSGDYERYFEFEGQRFHHILDPRTGYPARGTRSVTVIHENAAQADAAVTALFVAGPERWLDIAQQMGMHYVMLLDDEDVLHVTEPMQNRLVLERQPAAVRVYRP